MWFILHSLIEFTINNGFQFFAQVVTIENTGYLYQLRETANTINVVLVFLSVFFETRLYRGAVKIENLLLVVNAAYQVTLVEPFQTSVLTT